MEQTEKLVVSINEAAQMMGISRSMLYKEIGEGHGPKTIKIGSRHLVSVESLREWIGRLGQKKGTV